MASPDGVQHGRGATGRPVRRCDGLTARNLPVTHQITIAWKATPYAAFYRIKRSAISGGPFSTLASGVKATGYVDSAAHSGRRYYYVVSAANVLGDSADSSQATALAK